MRWKDILKAAIPLVVALAFIMPGSAAFVNKNVTMDNHQIVRTTSSFSPNWLQEAKLVASDGAPPSFFGFSVAIDGDIAIAGAWYQGGLKGAAYVYTRTGTTWTQEKKLTASDGAPPDEFGYSVSISGNTALVGSYNNLNGQGSAYVFTRTGTNWTEEGKLIASDGVAGDGFGYTVSIDGDTALVGAWRDENITGAAYVYTRTGTNWTQQAKLTASDGDLNDQYGYSVAIDGDSAIIGARGNEAGTGAAYVYTRTDTTWTEQAKLTASDGQPDDLFGQSVSISGDSAIAGATGNTSKIGYAYTYKRTGTTWAQEAKITGSDSIVGNGFAWDVTIKGDYFIAGTPGGDGNNGSAYVFTHKGTTWVQEAKLTASDAAPGDFLGISVAIDGDSAIAGAFGDGGYIGSAYIFRKQVVLEIGTLKGGLGITTTIKSTGIANATNVAWTITVTGGFLGHINKTAGDTIANLAAGTESDPLKTGLIFGLGKIQVTVTATCDEGAYAEKTMNGIQIIILSMIR